MELEIYIICEIKKRLEKREIDCGTLQEIGEQKKRIYICLEIMEYALA